MALNSYLLFFPSKPASALYYCQNAIFNRNSLPILVWLSTTYLKHCHIQPVLFSTALGALLDILVQFSSVAQSCPTLCNPMDCSRPGLPVHHQLPEFTQTHVHWVSDAIQPSHPLLSPSPPTLNLSQHQGLFKWVNSLHQVAKVLELQLQHQSFQRRTWELSHTGTQSLFVDLM